ncbi:hypothetical protein PEPE_1011 [Pediococcus pentosaceus ATCC 25745]|uniref:Uncharacterized protein n=1 Tax=Pediococcus pentosaceus (strain ATCC 25745 / CCUG 21536 / LMG 10740 / 183-1w) TaxID=278197 RepID=Q03FF5_PEDPA|nr:hypothetical protein PEPE_1011 [Pediococcus pentosaceus ATCC 25745]
MQRQYIIQKAGINDV